MCGGCLLLVVAVIQTSRGEGDPWEGVAVKLFGSYVSVMLVAACFEVLEWSLLALSGQHTPSGTSNQ